MVQRSHIFSYHPFVLSQLDPKHHAKQDGKTGNHIAREGNEVRLLLLDDILHKASRIDIILEALSIVKISKLGSEITLQRGTCITSKKPSSRKRSTGFEACATTSSDKATTARKEFMLTKERMSRKEEPKIPRDYQREWNLPIMGLLPRLRRLVPRGCNCRMDRIEEA